MHQPPRKIFIWAVVLLGYAVLVVAVFSLLRESQASQPAVVTAPLADVNLPALLAAAQAGGHTAVLLPLGPEAQSLPGLPELWDEFSSAGAASAVAVDEGGFDAMQGVDSAAVLTRQSVAELFLDGTPLQVFRRAGKLLVLNDDMRVQIVDCDNPVAPRLAGELPYDQVKRMVMRGDIAYLLTGSAKQPVFMVIADLAEPGEPRELARFEMPADAVSFYLAEGQLVVTTIDRERLGEGAVYLYQLSDDHRLTPLASLATPVFNNGFLHFGNYCVIPDLRAGLHVYDCRDPLRPLLVASLRFADTPKRLVRRSDKVFALGTMQRIHVVDLQEPRRPRLSAVVTDVAAPVFLVGHDEVTYYFSPKGNLQVVPRPLEAAAMRENRPDRLAGELVAQPGGGLLLLGAQLAALPAGIAKVLPPPDGAPIIAATSWQGGVAALHEDGEVTFYHRGEGAAPPLQGRVQLPGRPRWLAAGGERLYAGGRTNISVITRGGRQLSVTGQLELPGVDSRDGLVVGRTLCVAAGRDGLLSFSLDDPDRPLADLPLDWPVHLDARFDVRQLVAAGGGRVLAAAGQAGLLDSRPDRSGRLRFAGLLAFDQPVTALAVINGVALAATTDEVSVVDLGDGGTLQKLGVISFPGVARLTAASAGHWAGFVPGRGWSVLAAPRLMPAREVARLDCSVVEQEELLPSLYRLSLFNDLGVQTLPAPLQCAGLSIKRTAPAGQNGH